MTPRPPIQVGLLGAGGINAFVAHALHAGAEPRVRVAAVAGRTPTSASATALAELLGARVVEPREFHEAGCSWVVEAAGRDAIRSHVVRLWEQGVHTVVMSIGALTDPEVHAAYERARDAGTHVVLPSGGIAGLDGVRSLAASSLRRARITSTKAPAGLRGAPYLEANRIELPTDRVVTVFEGSAREAVEGFPANVNVAAALSLAGLGPDDTEVIMRSDPDATSNVHVIELEGDAASMQITVRSRPSRTNPRTSNLAGSSALAALQDIARWWRAP